MLSALRCLIAACLLAAVQPLSAADATADLPDDVDRQIDEQTEHLPDELRDKIREKIKEKAEEQLEKIKAAKEAAGEASSEESEEEDEKTEDKKEDDEKKKEEKKPTPLSDKSKELRSEMELYDTEFKHKVFEYKKQLETQLLMLEKTKLDSKIESERASAAKTAQTRDRDRMKLDLELAKLRREFEKQAFEVEISRLEAEKKRIETELAVENSKESLENRVLGEENYPDEPFQDGVLSISPRRIELNGPIMTGAADYVCQRLHYFNNRSDKPIFLVIDNSPGGSAIEGMQIVQAIQESNAPVHVVVKRFAASMAAIITTLADHSYCYPNALVLHHQASSALIGNGRSMVDQKKMFDEISRRLIGAVAEKVGLSEEEFVDQMYENRVSGDWELFGDQAVEKKWVDRVVDLVREESIRKRPTGMRSSPLRILRLTDDNPPTATGYLERYEASLVEEVDAQGRSFVRLPRLSPIDAWLIYNPGEYYR